MMAKSFRVIRRHYDLNNLTQDYRKENKELKEILEVVTDGMNDKTEKND